MGFWRPNRSLPVSFGLTITLSVMVWLLLAAMPVAASDGEDIAREAVEWTQYKTHFMEGAHGSVGKSWCLNPVTHLAKLSGPGCSGDQCEGCATGYFYCQSFSGTGDAANRCDNTSVGEDHHFDCVGFVCRVFLELGIEDDYVYFVRPSNLTGIPFDVPSLKANLTDNGIRWREHPAGADPFDYSWATHLSKGSVLIFAEVEQVDGRYRFATRNGQPHLTHSAICTAVTPEAELVSCRVSCKPTTSCPVIDPSDSGVKLDNLQQFLNVAKAAVDNPGSYCDYCKYHGLYGYFEVCSGSITVRKFRDLDMDGEKDGNEEWLGGWPVKLSGPGGDKYGVTCSTAGCLDGNGDPVPIGAYRFVGLSEGQYTVSEETQAGQGDQISWTLKPTQCTELPTNQWYWDRRTEWPLNSGQYWQSTKPAAVPYLVGEQPGPVPAQSIELAACQNATVDFGNVCLTPVQACKSKDRDMDGNPDSGGAMDGWPFTVTGTRADGRPICPMTKTTGLNGCVTFDQPNELLPPGKYTIAEVHKDSGSGPQWTEDPTICMGQTLYTDWRTTWDGERWQSTKPRPEDSCRWLNGQRVKGISPSYCLEITDCSPVPPFQFTNVCLGEMSAFKFHDKNMNGLYEPDVEPYTDTNGNGTWDPAEPFTDLTPACDGKWNEGEYKRDLNGNGVWDPAEPFVDLDGDKLWDEPECPIEGWPFRLFGTRADGRWLCMGDGPNLVKTDANGIAVFKDVPPPLVNGISAPIPGQPDCELPYPYTLTERFDIGHCANNPNPGWQPEITWNKYQLGPNWFAWRTTYGPIHPVCPPNGCDVTRWESTPAATDGGDRPASLEQSPLYVYCDPTPTVNFGNVCLTTVDGLKLVYDDGVPGVGTPEPGAGWEICLAGKDLAGRDIVPSDAALNPITAVAAPPIDLPCKSPVWHSVLCDANGHFRFTDLPPGHYELMERVDCDYKLTMSKPMLSGFNLECCPEYVELQNFRKDLITNVYQVYPGDSNGREQHNSGYSGLFGELISAVPGVLKIVPGPDWTNFKQGEQLCRETPIKTILLQKKFEGFSQCGDFFYPLTVSQLGRNNIRLWWPLMYEPPTTTWTLKIIYGTRTPVQFPGECIPGYVHEEVWKWTVDADIPHMRLFVDLLHETPFGLDEVPLISDEALYPQLLSRLDAIQAAAETDTVSAGLLLGEFEMTVMDACIAASPARPAPTGPGTGIANSFENPACCKLLVDSEYVGKKLGIWQQVK